MAIILDGTTGITAPDITSAAGLDASDINDGAVTAAKLHTTAVTDKLGYTPVNKAGDTMTGSLDLNYTNSRLQVRDSASSKGMSIGLWDTSNNRIETAGGNFRNSIYGNYSYVVVNETYGGFMEMLTNGTMRHNVVDTFYSSGTVGGNQTLSVDIPLNADDSSTGTVLFISASMTHHPSYDCFLDVILSRRGTGYSTYEQARRDTGNSGSWSVSCPNNTTVRVSKSAGSYAGSGPWWIKATWRHA